MILAAIVLAVCLAGAAGVPAPFAIPEVRIEVYHPRGFRVSIPHVEGVRMFAFHGNINRPMRSFEVGQFFKDVMHPVAGAWIYENRTARLHRGDKLYYWIYVLHEKLGYRRDDQVFRVEDVPGAGSPEAAYIPEAANIPQAGYIPTSIDSNSNCNDICKDPVPPTKDELDDSSQNLKTCETTLLKFATQSTNLLTDLESERKTTEILRAVLEKSPKKLTVSGNISRQEEPTSVVKFILFEKLSLRPEIASAVRNADHSITFELATVDALITVVKEAQTKLANSRSVAISY